MVNYSDAIKKGFSFAFRPKRWLPFFVLDVAVFCLALTYILVNVDYFLSNHLFLGASSTSFLGPLAILGAVLFTLLIVWGLFRLWLSGAVVHQSFKEKDFKKSFRASCKKYPSMLVATIIVMIISILISSIPLVGWAFNIVISLAFFFILQSIIVKNMGVKKAIRDGCNIFWSDVKKNFRKSKNLFYVWIILLVIFGVISTMLGAFSLNTSIWAALAVSVSVWIMLAVISGLLIYSRVFLMWLIIAVFSVIILLIFTIPCLALMFNVMLANAVQMSSMASQLSMLFLLLKNIPALLITCVIFLVGYSISGVLALKMQTEFYLQMKKKKLGTF